MGLIYDAILHLHKRSDYLVKDVSKWFVSEDDFIKHANICEIRQLNKRSLLDRLYGLTDNGADIFEDKMSGRGKLSIARYKVNNKIIESA